MAADGEKASRREHAIPTAMRWWSQSSSWVRVAVGAASAALVVVVAVALLKWFPQLLSDQHLSGKDAAEDRGRIRTAVLALLAGGLAAVGAVYTARTFALNRAGQITERFTRAVDQLGNAAIDVRLGGIYALERIVHDSPDYQSEVMQVLSAFVREHAPWAPQRQQTGAHVLDVRTAAVAALERVAMDPASLDPEDDRPNDVASDRKDGGPASAREPTPATDVMAALRVLLRRNRSQDQPAGTAQHRGFRLDLRNTDLRGALLNQADLRGAWLDGVHLEGAFLRGATLDAVPLKGAYLEGARLEGASLRGATLDGAHLNGARLGDNPHDEADLHEAFYDDDTEWPDDFDKTSSGVKKSPDWTKRYME